MLLAQALVEAAVLQEWMGLEKEGNNMKNIKQKLKIIIPLIILFIIIGVFQVYSAQKAQAERKAATDKQRQVMTEYYQEQGLSEEEIQTKISEEFSQNNEDRPWYSSIMRTVRHSTGTGPGTNK